MLSSNFSRYQSNWATVGCAGKSLIRGGYITLSWQDLLLIPPRCLWDDHFRDEAESKLFSPAKRGQMRQISIALIKLLYVVLVLCCFWNEGRVLQSSQSWTQILKSHLFGMEENFPMLLQETNYWMKLNSHEFNFVPASNLNAISNIDQQMSP